MSENQTLASVVGSVGMPVERRFRVVGQVADNSGMWITLRENQMESTPAGELSGLVSWGFPNGPAGKNPPFIVSGIAETQLSVDGSVPMFEMQHSAMARHPTGGDVVAVGDELK